MGRTFADILSLYPQLHEQALSYRRQLFILEESAKQISLSTSNVL
jgi:dsRNA-specific ribonuclease